MNLHERAIAILFSRSRARAAAFAFAAAAMLVPANYLPVVKMDAPGQTHTDTIFSSIVGLWKAGLWPLGIIVFVASMLVPFLKLAGIAWLLVATRRGRVGNARALTRLYATLDFIGRWSMLDVFLVAFLSGAVQFGAFANVEPRGGVVAFAMAVTLTILATRAFEPREIWATAAPGGEGVAP